jgi:hypothetical protein
MSDRIVCFIDALPWAEHTRISKSIPEFAWARPLQPGFGYSVNVKSELFAGHSPDEAGFLNEWTHRPGAGIMPVRVPLIIERLLPSTSLVGRVMRKLLGRALKEDVRNIPLHLLAHLGREGTNAYEYDYKLSSLFTQGKIERFLYTEYGGDVPAFDALISRLGTSCEPVHAFLAGANLDHVMHKCGIGTKEYESAIQQTIDRLKELVHALRSRPGNAQLVLVSDHGMAPVQRSVSIDLEEPFGRAGEAYGYFVDATMLRVWCSDSSLLQRIRNHICEKELPGRFLDSDERTKWGVSSNAFGDLLLLLDEGVMFAPGFMGRAPVKAMHGYLPNLASQTGLLMATAPLFEGADQGAVPATEAFRAFQTFFDATHDRRIQKVE